MEDIALSALFGPSTVAVIGASRRREKVGHVILSNLVEGGFDGEIVPVNPEADELLGLSCYSSLQKYGKPVDLCVIAVPPPAVAEAVRGSIRAGVKAVVVVTAGFRETGEEGRLAEEELVRLCRSGGARLLGPNCLGLVSTGSRLNASFAGGMPQRGGISVFSQSGALCTAILDTLSARKLGLAKVVSVGNKADLSEVDLLLALARDGETKVVVGYLEDIRSGDEFMAAAEEASTSKPVILMKAGTTDAGRRAATSHTGVIAGAEIAYGAAFRRSGVVRADTYDELFDSATAFAMQPLPKGDRVLVITNAGGPGTMAADAIERAGLQVAAGTPVDVLGDADPQRYADAFAAAQENDDVDAVLVILTPQAMTRPAETARAVAGAIRGDKPVLAVFMGGSEVMPGREELVKAGLPDYGSPERAVAALANLRDYALWKRRPARMVTRFRVNRRRVERIIARRLRAGENRIGEVRSKNILRAYGFMTPEGAVGVSAEEAVEAAERIGYPVAVKIVSPDIVHKSDIGGVKLNLSSGAEVEDAFELMMLRVRQRAPEARIEGAYVEKMLPRGVEVIIGMSRDPQFGPMLMFGLGGIFVEVMKDVTFHLAPVTHDEALQMLVSTRSYEILQGARGQRAVDLGAVATGLQRISQLTTDFPLIEEVDINPFMVGEIGREPFVADARITVRSEKR
jgi:acetyltransferase